VPRADLGRTRGFTLVEVMVALVISGILITVVFQMMNGQTRIVAVQSSREEVQQNVRGGLEVISSELRGAIPGAILQADADALTFMQPRAWGMLCTDIAVGTTVVNVIFPTTDVLGAFDVDAASGLLINRGDPNGANWLPDPYGVNRAGIASAVSQGAPTMVNCPLNAVGGEVVRITSTVGLPAAVAGDLVATYSLTRYDVGDTEGRLWLKRSNGISDAGVYQQQPLAGPLEAGKFRLTYYAGTPAVAVPAPGNNSVVLRTLKMVRVQVVTNSTQRIGGRIQRDSGAVTVMLRN
jgi:prepilin-type N-terminal cleavage/methylation domain-containing protein